MPEGQLLTGRLATLVDVLRDKALRIPDQEAYRFLLDGENKTIEWSYLELDRRSRALAMALRERGGSGERAVLLYPPGLEFIAAFFGCLYEGVVAVPAYPPVSRRVLPRLEAILRDVRPTLILTTAEIFAKAASLLSEVSALAHSDWLVTDRPEDLATLESRAQAWRDPGITGETMAFIQYTSGSTSAPKGVEVHHNHLLSNQRMIRDGFEQTRASVIVGWLPLYHDMGLIGNVIQPLYVGARCILMSPLTFLRRPARWLEAISRYRATTSGGPNFAYELCVRKVSPEHRQNLDLSSWKVAYNGAEPVRAATLDRFSDAFAANGFRRESFYPCYGLAEATLFVTGGVPSQCAKIVAVESRALEQHRVAPAAEEGDPTSRRLVGCGRTAPDQRLLIVDPETREPLAPDQVGEIWVAGPSVAGGYWKNPEETERVFAAHTFQGDGPFLRTGDLGFVRADGELLVTGRHKDLIILRGRNYYPQDLELASEMSHPALRPGGCAAFALDVEDEERLALVQELERHFRGDVAECVVAIRQAVAEQHQAHVHTVVLISAGSLPKTSSGKVQRRYTRELFLTKKLNQIGISVAERSLETQGSETIDAVPAWSREELSMLGAEQRLSALLDYSLNLAARAARLAPEAIDPAAPLTGIGLDSLMAVELKNQIDDDLGVALPLAELLYGPSLDELVPRLDRLLMAPETGEAAPVLAPAGDAADSGMLSYGQRALWFLQRLAPESSAYNIAAAVRVKAALDVDRLRRILDLLAQRHAVLRSVFRATSDGPRREVLDEQRVALVVEDAASQSPLGLEERVAREVNAPFDLERDALMRVLVLRCSGHASVVVMVVHHIVSDLASLGVLLAELRTLYELAPESGVTESGAPESGVTEFDTPALAPLPVAYRDYVHWQQRLLDSPTGERLWRYWQRRLEGDLPVLTLPTDRPRPLRQSFQGAASRRLLDGEVSAGIRALAEQHGATLYSFLLTAFQTLLARYSGQRDVLVGTPALGRTQSELGHLVGYFVNPVVMRADLRSSGSFTELLSAARASVIEALEHQDYPFALLVERLQPERDLSRSPIFQAMFGLQQSGALSPADLAAFALGYQGVELDFAGLPAESLPFAQRIAQFDLELIAAEMDGQIGFSLLYDTALFDSTTAARFLEHLCLHLERVVAEPGEDALTLPLLGPAERQILLCEWNDRRASGAPERLFHRLFEAQVEEAPGTLAMACEAATLTYAELNHRANRLARALLEYGVAREARVAVLAERGLDLASAIVAIFKAGAVYVPLDPRYPAERIRSILEQCRSSTLLLSAPLAPLAERATASLAAAPRLCELEALLCEASRSEENLPLAGSPEALAYVIFTSGSTGVPKGAMVAHRGMLNHLEAKIEDLAITASDTVAQNASQCFDISVWQFLAALVVGGSVRIFPDEVAADPARLPAEVEATGVTLFETVPSMLQAMLTQLASAPDAAQPAFGALRWLIPTGEVLTPELSRQWLARQGQIPLVNAYGPTECSDDVTHAVLRQAPDPGALRVAIGRPIRNTRLYVLSSGFVPVPIGVVGELCVGGSGVGRGYLFDPRRTAEAFRPDPFADPGDRLYKTGDLARYRLDGQLEFLGRMDHQVKVRGFRVEVEEIEKVLRGHPAVREVLVMARQDGSGPARLVACWVAHRSVAEISPEGFELRKWVAASLPEYMVPSVFLALRSLPLTPNGKVDRAALNRKALPEPEPAASPTDLELLTPTEELVAKIWSEVLGLSKLDPDAGFFDLGGHSLLATQVVSRIRDLLGVDLELRELLENLTVRSLAVLLERRQRQEVEAALPPLVPVSRERDPALSFAQERLWFLDQLQPGLVAYNMPAALMLEGGDQVPRVERALTELVRRHETLRTTFRAVDGEPFQVIAAEAQIALPRVDLSSLSPVVALARARRLAAEDADRAFDLARGPLLRTTLVLLGGQKHLLLINLHHIIADGWSLQVLIREISALCWSFAAGEPSSLARLPVQYADFAVWQRSWLGGELRERLLAYWREQLREAPKSLDLPLDRPRPKAQTFSGAGMAFALPAEVFGPLDGQARQHTVTLFMSLLAAFQVVLHRYSGQRDVLVGSPIANRNRSEVEGLIGFFVNTLVLRTDFIGDPSFVELLGQVRETTLGAYMHQDLPFERLVEELKPERLLSQSPLFQVLFALQDPPFQGLELPELSLTPLESYRQEPAKFDLELYLWRDGEGLGGQLIYNTDLFDATTIRRLLRQYELLLRGVVEDAGEQLSRRSLMSTAERAQLVGEWNDTAVETVLEGDPIEGDLVRLVTDQAARTPDAVALVHGSGQLSYGELDRRSTAVALALARLGVGPEVCVGLATGRTPQMVVAMLGILKAGGAYVPLDPTYPARRLAFILEDTRAPAVLTEDRWRDLLPASGATLLSLDSMELATAADANPRPATLISPSQLAYVIYTSGSTGQPKGVAIAHASAVRLVRWAQQSFEPATLASVLAATSINFDLSVFELFVPLASGGRIALADNALALAELPYRHGITLINTVPSAATELLRLGAVPASVRVVNLAGEALHRELVAELLDLATVEWVWNLYGPSEDTTYSTATRMGEAPAGRPTIGRPVSDTRAFVLRPDLRPVSLGAVGELYLGGGGLSRGYLARPALTAARYLPDPFAPEPGGRLYRTGDLVRYLAAGELDFLGRGDHQVKVRGFRIELGEIESVLAAAAEVRDNVVAIREVAGSPAIVAYVVRRDAAAPAGPRESQELAVRLARHLAERLPRHMVPMHFTVLEALPHLPNGKVDRAALMALPDPQLALEAGDAEALRTPQEELLAGIWAEVLGLPRVGVRKSFFELGGHSLLLTQLISRVRGALGVEMPLASVFDHPTVESFAAEVEAVRGQRTTLGLPTIEPTPRDGQPLPLSYAQERLWLVDQLASESSVFNLFQALRLSGPLDVVIFERCFRTIFERHESLRTVIRLQHAKPVQVIETDLELEMPRIDLSAVAAEEQEELVQGLGKAQARRPFQLDQGPLLRISLLRLGPASHVVLVTIHHIVGDDWSTEILQRELTLLYQAFVDHRSSPLPELPVQYADYALWQRQWLTDEVLEPQLEYWQEQLRGELPILNLKTGRRRPPTLTFRGARYDFGLSAELATAVETMSRSQGVTPFMSLLAAYAIVLYRFSNQDDIIVGAPVANRNRMETEGLIGFFVNILPLRIDLSGEPSYRELLRRIRKISLAAYDHQDLPFERLVQALQLERDLSRTPIRQVGFSFLKTSLSATQLRHDITVRPIPVDTGTAPLDLGLILWQDGDEFQGTCEYSPELLDEPMISRFVESLKEVLVDMSTDLERPLIKVPPLLTAASKPSLAVRETAQAAVSRLTENQSLYYFAEKLQEDFYYSHVRAVFEVSGELDQEAFSFALGQTIAASDSLRSTVFEDNGVPYRRVLPEVGEPLTHLDLSSHADPPSAFDSWLEERCRPRPTDFSRRLLDCVLVKVAPRRFMWFLSAHHIILDALSLEVLFRSVARGYAAMVEGRSAPGDPLPSYRDYVEAEKTYQASARYEKAKRYWQQKLASEIDPIPFYRKSATKETSKALRRSVSLSDGESRRLRELTAREDFFSISVLPLTVLVAYLYRLSGYPRLRIGTTFANRSSEFGDLIGLLINNCPLEIELEASASFGSLARKLQVETVRTGKHQQYPVRNFYQEKTYDVYFNHNAVQFGELCGMPVHFDLLSSGRTNNSLDVQLRDFDATGCWSLDFDFNRAAFEEAEAQRSVGHLMNLLGACLKDPAARITTASLLSLSELRQLDSVGAPERMPEEPCLHQLFAAQAARSPEAIAVACGDERLSYRELDRRADRLAKCLRRLGVGPEKRVGLFVERSLDTVLGILGILKAGGAYLPLDPAYPAQRLAIMLADAQVAVLLTQEDLASGVVTSVDDSIRMLHIDGDWEQQSSRSGDTPITETPPVVQPGHLAYVIYTSGSTGTPKGTLVTHRNVTRLFASTDDWAELSDRDVWTLFHSSAFDFSVWEIWGALLYGGRLVVVPYWVSRAPEDFYQLLIDERVTVLNQTPSAFLGLIRTDQKLAEESSSALQLRLVVFGGEALEPRTLAPWFRRYGDRSPQLVNMYGITETTVHVTHCPLRREDATGGTSSIGQPLADLKVDLLDGHLNRLPMGIPGEIHVGGGGLSRGYLHRPGLTAQRFVPDPFARRPGERLYRAGDLAHHQPYGDLAFLGRIDHQVKIRGFRIELGEIEAVIAQHAGVGQILVTDWRDDSGTTRLAAYMTAAGASPPSSAEMRQHTATQLPEYMVPMAWIVLEALPLTPSGKIDRRALPKPDLETAVGISEEEFAEPTTPLEMFLASVFAEVLDIETVSTQTSFFELGGNSLMATQVVSLVQDILPLKLELRNIFEAPTIVAIATQIEESRTTMSREEKELMDELLEDFQRLSEGEEE